MTRTIYGIHLIESRNPSYICNTADFFALMGGDEFESFMPKWERKGYVCECPEGEEFHFGLVLKEDEAPEVREVTTREKQEFQRFLEEFIETMEAAFFNADQHFPFSKLETSIFRKTIDTFKSRNPTTYTAY